MEMPKPTPEHDKLARLAGTWRGTETMHPSEWNPQGCTAQGVTSCRVALGGFGVVVDYEQSVGGAPTFSGHGVYTWDQNAQQVVLHWFDSMGTGCEQFRGGWQGDRLVLTSDNPMMGRMRMTYAFTAEGRMTSAMECAQDGTGWKTLFEGVYDRAD